MPWTNVPIKFHEPILLSSENDRCILYKEAIREAIDLALTVDKNVFVFGEGIDDAGGVFGTTKDLHLTHGIERVSDTPLSEQALTGIAIGASTMGMRPILVHMRCDFLPLTLDQLGNHAAKWRYMTGGKSSCPIVVRAIIGRGWGSAAQHSQSLAAIFAHFPGLDVFMPATPYDAKGMLLAAIASDNPTLIIEHRWLFEKKGPVREGKYLAPPQKVTILRQGTDITIAAFSIMVYEALEAAKELSIMGINPEIIDMRSLRPLDKDSLCASVAKTGRLLVADVAHGFCGASAELIATVAEKTFKSLKAPPIRVVLPDCPTPACETLEKAFYPGAKKIVEECRKLF